MVFIKYYAYDVLWISSDYNGKWPTINNNKLNILCFSCWSFEFAMLNKMP